MQYPHRVRSGKPSEDSGGGGNNPAVLQKGGVGAGNEAGRDNDLQLAHYGIEKTTQKKQAFGCGNYAGESNLIGNNPVAVKKGGIGAGNEAGRDNNLQLVHNDVREMVKEKQTVGSGNYAGGNNVTFSGSNYNVYMLPPWYPNAPCDTKVDR